MEGQEERPFSIESKVPRVLRWCPGNHPAPEETGGPSPLSRWAECGHTPRRTESHTESAHPLILAPSFPSKQCCLPRPWLKSHLCHLAESLGYHPSFLVLHFLIQKLFGWHLTPTSPIPVASNFSRRNVVNLYLKHSSMDALKPR